MTKSGRPTIDDALARRISDALSSDAGLAGDTELSSKLATDKAAGSYAKDLGRIDKWLASWPLPEPSEEQLEALASRVEQRLKDLPTGSMLPFLAPPDFDDDDALRDATASLLTSGKVKVPAAKAVIPKPAALLVPEARGAGAAKPEPAKKALDVGTKTGVGKLPQSAKPLEAKAPLGKPVAKVPLPTVEPPAAAPPAVAAPAAAPPEPAAEPALVQEKPVPLPSAAAAEVDAAVEPPPPAAEAEATTASPSAAPPAPETSGEYQTISLPPEAAEPLPEVAVPKPPKAVTAKAKDDSKKIKHESPPKPPKRALGPAANAKVDDRISIPMPTPLAPVVQLDAARPAAAEKKKGGGLWPLLAAAAVVGLTVAVGGSFLFAGRNAEPASAPIAAAGERRENEGAAATVTSAPAVASVAPAAPAVPAAAVPMGGAATFAEMPAEPEAEGLLRSDSIVTETSTREPAAAESTGTPVAARRARVGGGDDDLYRAGPGSSGSRGSPSTGSSPSTASADDAEGRSTGGSAGGARSGAGGGAARGGAASGSTASGGSGASPPTDGASGSGGRVRGGEVASGGDLPESPSRDAVRDALDGVAPQVYACYGDDHGLAEVAVIVAGSGRVTTCTVSGRFAGTPVGSCIARAVRAARFPAFSSPRFEVHYEYRH